MRLLTRTAVIVAAAVAFLAPSAAAQWLRLDTEHFRIIYDAPGESTAAELAGFADELYEEVSGYLGIHLNRRVPVVVRSGAPDANGYFTQLPERIVIFTPTPSTPIVHPNLDEWLRTVFVHEITHYLHLSESNGWNILSWVFGPGLRVANLVFMPRWMAEGIAIHTETEFTAGGRGRSPVFEMQYVAAVLADEFWSFDQNRYGSDFAPRSRPYVGGYVIADYIIRTWDVETFIALSRRYVRHPLPGIRPAIQRVLGVSAEELYRAVVADLEARYDGRAALGSGELVSPAEHGYWFLVRGSDSIYGSAVSGYSRLLPAAAWSNGISGRELRSALHFVVDPYSISENDELVIGIRSFADTWSPDPNVGFTDLVAIDRRTGAERRVTTGRRLYHSTLTPDGTRAVAVERTGAYSRLVAVDLRSGEVSVVWEPESTHMSGPTVSPDGSTVALAASRDGEQDLYTVDLAHGTVTRLTRSRGIAEYFPVYLDTNRLWFTADPDGPLALYELDLANGRVERRLADAVGIFYATPAGDGAVYAGYSVTGPSVKRVDTLERVPVDWPGGTTVAGGGAAGAATNGGGAAPDSTAVASLQGDAGGAAPAALPGARLHVDWPVPQVWLPLFFPPSSLYESGLVLGGVLMAASVREKNVVEATSLVEMSRAASYTSLGWTHLTGPWQLQLGALVLQSPPTSPDGRSDWDTVGSAGIARTIAAWQSARHSQSMSAALSASLSSADNPQTPVGPVVFQTGATAGLSGTAALGWQLRRETRRVDLYGPAGATAAVAAEAASAPDGAGLMSFAVSGTATLRAPVGPAMGHLSLAAASPGSAADIDAPRALPVSRDYAIYDADRRLRPALAARLGMDSPALLTDRVWRRQSITGLGLSGYVEQVVDYGDAGAGLRPETTFAAEVVARIGLFSVPVTPAVGVLVTVPHADPAAARFSVTVRLADAQLGIVIGRETAP